MKRIKILAAFLYIVLILFAMANLFPKDNFTVMSFLRVENWHVQPQPEPAVIQNTSLTEEPFSFYGFYEDLKARFSN